MDKLQERSYKIEIPEGQLERGTSEISESECKEKCDRRSDCKSFAYSRKERHCKLMSIYDPPVECKNPKKCYKDFAWCSRGTSKYNYRNYLSIF